MIENVASPTSLGAAPSTAPSEIKRFGADRIKQPHPFRIGDSDEVYYAAAKLPTDILVELLEKFTSVSSSETTSTSRAKDTYAGIISMFEMVMFDDSFAALRQRLRDKRHPVDIDDLIDVMYWLIGDCYSLRPTPRPSSSGGSSARTADGGNDSTAGALPAGLIQLASTGLDSSI